MQVQDTPRTATITCLTACVILSIPAENLHLFFEQAPEATNYVLPFGLGRVDVALGCPGLDTLHYAFDFAIPIIDLGQDSFCRFVPNGEARWLWLVLHSLFGLLGGCLSAVVILTLTGVLRRD